MMVKSFKISVGNNIELGVRFEELTEIIRFIYIYINIAAQIYILKEFM